MTEETKKLSLTKSKKANATLEAAKKKVVAPEGREELTYPGVQQDFEGMSFAGKDLTRKNDLGQFLYNFKTANLRNADFTGANLEGQCFQGAHLEGADFTGANCVNADFRWSYMNDVITDDADFTGADLREAVGI